jgi:hypothetical protein
MIDPEEPMDSRKFILKETAIITLGQVLCVGAMVGIFALLGAFDRSVLLGGIAGGLLAVLNFLLMAIGTSIASDKAQNQDVKGGQATIQLSYFGRMILIAVVLFALVKSGLCNVITAVLPLAFTRPILTIAEFFRKSGV